MSAPSCPSCASINIRVFRPYHATNSDHIVRRRHCTSCSHRWYSIQPPEREISGVYLHWIRRHEELGHCVELLEGALP